MRPNRPDARRASRSRALLTLSLHLAAARRAPGKYLAACWWRLCGKRVRARARFAVLLAASPQTYRLWQLDEGAVPGEGVGTHLPSIVALVEVGTDRRGLDATLRSLSAEGVVALLVGPHDLASPAAAAASIDEARDTWLMPLAAGDLLAQGAGAAYRAAAGTTAAGLIYADDDLVADDGERVSPHFKPEWNNELFRHFDYLTGACMVRAETTALLGLPQHGWAASIVGASAHKRTPLHIPRVLHHRRRRPRARVTSAVGIVAGELPEVTMIVPTRNRMDLLRTCLEGLARTAYPGLDVIVVDNDSDDPATLAYLDSLDRAHHRVLHHPGPFNFSAINNRAAQEARGRLLCLLNNDIEVIEPGWLQPMARQALREDVGAVGARLLYPDGRIQHAGVVLGVGGGAAHAHRLLRPDEEGYFSRHALPQFVSAVTAACLVVQRDRFLAVDGLDERRFAVAFNDVDLCLRLNQRGWQSLYEPRATLIHHESLSRGFDRDPVGAARFAGELAALKQLWLTDEQVDPFHHPQLSPFSEQFVLRL